MTKGEFIASSFVLFTLLSMSSLALSLLKQKRVSEQQTTHSNLHTKKDYVIHKLIDYLGVCEQINYYYLTSVNALRPLDPAVNPFASKAYTAKGK